MCKTTENTKGHTKVSVQNQLYYNNHHEQKLTLNQKTDNVRPYQHNLSKYSMRISMIDKSLKTPSKKC